MKPRWHVALDATRSGRCYLSWNTCLIDILRETGRLAEPGQEYDVFYAQAGLFYPKPPAGVFVALQSVTAPSKVHAPRAAWAWEYDAKPNLVMAYSVVGKQSLLEVGVSPGLIRVVCPGISPCGFTPTDGDVPRIVGYAGQEIERKQWTLALQAAEAASAEFKRTNDTPHDQMPAWYRTIGLLALPSMLESWGIVASEAIASGVPAVVYDGCGCSEEIAENGAGIVVPVGNSTAFIGAVVEALESERHRELVAAARAVNPRTEDDWAVETIRTIEAEL